jgi:hypothetical protein
LDYKFQHDHSSTLDESNREGKVRKIAPGKSDEERLRTEVRTVFFSFALTGAANAIFGRYVGSFYFAAMAALIAVICALLFLIMLRR